MYFYINTIVKLLVVSYQELREQTTRRLLLDTTKDDIKIWHYDPKGVYTVRSGYRLANSTIVNPSSSGLSSQVSWWKFLWRLKIPSKIKIFIWRAYYGWLPTRQTLLERHVKLPVQGCPCCKSGSESIIHALWLCPELKEIRKQLPEMSMKVEIYKINFPELLLWCRQNIPQETMELISVLWWRIWFNRNRVIHNDLSMNRVEMLAWSRDYLEDFQRRILNIDPKQRPEVKHNVLRWSPPEDHSLKLNTDAAFNGGSRKMGLGMVLRNSAGQIIMAARKGLTSGVSAKIAEALAMKWGIQLSMEAGLQNFWVESDAKEIIQEVKSPPPLTELGTIIEDIQALLVQAHCLGINYIPRTANAVADRLAKDGMDCMDCKIWMEDVPPDIRNLVEADLL